ncbi:PAS domain S-box-containing protein [Desulfobotulus alkaliphilus]|uniref:histidine kinase n=1 Tax=Desulfobotulus alkaliphilus TaxID=622671 RepID=A0A562S6E0_9BACT|nr:PAS domain S-box protein [Desulfobotulus alkaliphilus]TWI76892.1 PAS domain S-box-containing protein [Desulfobotulus alkaliphilus]
MMYLDLVLNLALLIALSVVSGFISRRWPKKSRTGPWLQGLLFGSAAVFGMLKPLVLGPGLIFDGRSLMVSLCALFHGPLAGIIAALMPTLCRIQLGGVGAFTGILVILSSLAIGLAAHFYLKPRQNIPSTKDLFLFGLVVHLAMLALMLTLPGESLWLVIRKMAFPILIIYPLATVLAGRVLTEQEYAADALEKLKNAMKNLDTTLKSIGDAVIATDRKGHITLMNPVAENLTGWPLKEALQKPLTEVFRIVNAESRKTPDNPVEKVIASGRTEGLANHTLLIARDGRECQIADSAAPIFQEEGILTGVVLVFRDVSEEYRILENLKESEEDYRRLFEEHAAVKLILDPETGAVVDANQAAADYYGWSRETLKKKRIQDINTLSPEEIAAEIEKVKKEKRIHFEFRHRRADGSIRDVAVLSSVIRLKNKEYLHSIIHDISQRKRLEAQLIQSQKMESIGRLAGGVAHDFNNMLGIIMGNAELMETRLDARHPAMAELGEIKKAAERSTELTKQLLAFARRQTIAPRVLNLNQTIEGMLKMLHRLIGEGIELRWHPEENLRYVRMDSSQLDQILVNLTVNAKDAIAGVGMMTIETANASFEEGYGETHGDFIPGDYVMLAVSDNGCGIEKEHLPQLFEPFFTTKPQGSGTGLGLSMIYGIVRQNQGFINVYSEPGKGSTFRIYLPATDEESCSAPDAEKTSLPRGKECILLVEDEPALLQLTGRILEKLGYEVMAAATPEEALSLAEQHGNKIHLLLTDVVMPQMNGQELSLRIENRCPGIRSLFMSGYTANVIAHHGVLKPGIHFLQKPFSMKDLAEKIRETMAR